EPTMVHETLARQHAPVLATDGNGALLIWYEENATTHAQTLYGAFVDRNSTHVQTPFVIDTAAGDGAPAALVCNGSQYLVAWQSPATRRIRLARWTLEGSRIDPSPIAFVAPNGPGQPASTGDASPALAWNGRDYYLLFAPEHGDVPPLLITPPILTLHELHGVRLSADLFPVGPERLLSLPQTGSGEDATLPVVMADGNGYVAAWVQQSVWFGPSLVVARRIDANDGLSPAHGRAYTGRTAPQLARVGNETRLAFGTTIVNLDASGGFTNERTVEAPVVAMTSDGNRLLLVQSRFVDRTARLFLVPLAAARGRIVRGS
ncbi:MAG TPA: hypothetical protein VN605_02380, partial [Thermoanaerobaculia bacterium]|nr:hypothetical protein [Thermoanaerobaculia bacterium]